MGDHDLYAMLADTAIQQRESAAIVRYASLAEETASRYEHRLYQAISHRAWGVAHRLAYEYNESKTRLIQALDLFNDLGTRWQIGRTLFELGELALVQKDLVEARRLLLNALALFTEMKAAPDVARTEAILASMS